ncbi:MAG TPA: DUF2267 domain-containing protein [Amycolatopsis sp.]|uniref:DUF2267 domain-containing protein n=1 Tax=Amycolatopsis sp. TaxID=37632 RepID=UPI002B46B92A|nr:DUF2267 domain-containing protein [Amycolatopsis sp.]HKS47754.1 DUF2267 domain-containing protein [Amycolatopsis sp.]
MTSLAGQLPPGIAEALRASGGAERLGVEEFYRRVKDAEGRGCTQDGVREQARAVFASLKSRVSKGEFDDLVE